MGFFDKFNSKAELQNGWIELTEPIQLEAAIQQSFDKPVVFFKHSTRCGISVGAKYALEEYWDFSEEEMVFYYLDLITYRTISNAIADELKIIHQSPQVIVLRNGKAVHTNTHHSINIANLREGLQKAG